MRDRRLVLACVAGTACFSASIAFAIAHYPGGTWSDPAAKGHSFAWNFLCDLMQTRALNGQDATIGSSVARFGTAAMFGALAAFFTLVARFESKASRAGWLTQRAGLVACTFGCLIPLAPSDRFRETHVATVLFAFAPALVATIAAFVVCLRAPVSRPLRGLAAFTLTAGGLDGIAYAIAYAIAYSYVGTPKALPLINLALPLLQRAATLGLVAWVLAACMATTQRSET